MSRDPSEYPVVDPGSKMGVFRIRVKSVGAFENCAWYVTV